MRGIARRGKERFGYGSRNAVGWHISGEENEISRGIKFEDRSSSVLSHSEKHQVLILIVASRVKAKNSSIVLPLNDQAIGIQWKCCRIRYNFS